MNFGIFDSNCFHLRRMDRSDFKTTVELRKQKWEEPPCKVFVFDETEMSKENLRKHKLDFDHPGWCPSVRMIGHKSRREIK